MTTPAVIPGVLASADPRLARLRATARTTLGLFTDRNRFPNGVYSHASNTSGTFKLTHTILADVDGFIAVFPSSYVDGTMKEAGCGQNFNVEFAIRYNGTKIKATFGGNASVVVTPNGYMPQTDLIPVKTNKAVASTISLMTFCDAGSSPVDRTKLFPVVAPTQSYRSDGVIFGANRTGVSDTDPPTVGFSSAYGPVALIGYRNGNPVSVLIVGDSIGRGQNDLNGQNQSGLNGDGEYGFLQRAFDRDGIPRLTLATPGDSPALFVTSGNRTQGLSLIGRCNIRSAFNEYGANGVTAGTTLTQLKDRDIAVIDLLKANGVEKVAASSILPRNSSTDYFRTTANQTALNAAFAPGGAVVQLNDWRRSLSDGRLASYHETSDVVSTARNSQIWKAAILVRSETATSGTNSTITKTGAAWVPGEFQDAYVHFTGGTGYPQTPGTPTNPPRGIKSNSATVLTIWDAGTFNPIGDATTVFDIILPYTTDGTHTPSYSASLMAGVINTSVL